MKTVKSILAILLMCAFLAAFAACGSDTDDTATTAAPSSTTVGNSVVTTTATAATTVTKATTVAQTKKTQKKSETLKISEVAELISRTKNAKGNPSDSFVNSLKGYKLKVYYPWDPYKDGVAEIKKSMLDSEKAVEQEFGVDIDVDGKFEQYNETLTAKLTASSKDLCQIYMVQYFNFASYFKNNYLSDLTMAMVKSGVSFKDPWYMQEASEFFNINNKRYAWISYDADYTFPFCIVYNRSHIKNIKLTDPVELAKQGKWTWDTMIKYAQKLNGKNNGATGFATVDALDMVETMAQQKGTSLMNVKKNQSPTENLSDQTVKDCLSTLYTWCKDKGTDTICNTFSNQDWTYTKTQFVKGKISMVFGFHDTIQTLAQKKTDDEFAVVQFPTPTGSKTYKGLAHPHFAWFIPSIYSNTAKYDKDEVAKILFLRNEMYRQNYRYAQRNFSYLWNKYFDDTDTIEYCCNMKYARGNNKSTSFTWVNVCAPSGQPSVSTVVSEILKSSSNNVQTAITKNKDRIDKAYKSVWDGYKITGNV
ncbi:MAG: ABC transporter substrate-binding protein [Acutalibacteraceae bacterium]